MAALLAGLAPSVTKEGSALSNISDGRPPSSGASGWLSVYLLMSVLASLRVLRIGSGDADTRGAGVGSVAGPGDLAAAGGRGRVGAAGLEEDREGHVGGHLALAAGDLLDLHLADAGDAAVLLELGEERVVAAVVAGLEVTGERDLDGQLAVAGEALDLLGLDRLGLQPVALGEAGDLVDHLVELLLVRELGVEELDGGLQLVDLALDVAD